MGIPLTDVESLRSLFSSLGFVTAAGRMTGVLQYAYKAAQASDTTVLLQGETGTGKQVLARAIHRLDEKRKSFPFVTVHCSTVSEHLAESELFGHRRGSFSGAVSSRSGLFQTAEHGTVFLDDVNDLPLSLQPKLLDALQRSSIRPVGADREQRVDVRVIAAANRPLAPLVADGVFRPDLYHRLNVITLTLPPLRDRPEDLPALVQEFVDRYAALYEHIETLEPDLVQHLRTCRFEGNVRELENAVQRMLFMKSEGRSLTRADWLRQEAERDAATRGPDDIPRATNLLWTILLRQEVTFHDLIWRIEGELLRRALQVDGKTRREIAAMLHTSERTLYHKMSAHGIGAGTARIAE